MTGAGSVRSRAIPTAPPRWQTKPVGSACAASPCSRRTPSTPGRGRGARAAPPPSAPLPRPDSRWRKSPAAIERLVEVQAQLLRRAREALRPGGVLVYSTCTISSRENEKQLVGGQRIQLRTDLDCTTGFFIARLSRDDA